MKKNILYIIFNLALLHIFANDSLISYYNPYSGDPITVFENDVILESEIIKITIGDLSYKVEVEFTFYNPSELKKIKIGFPQYSKFSNDENSRRNEFINFETYVNGISTPFEIEQIEGFGKLHEFYVKDVTFLEGEYTTSRISYECKYSKASYGELASYIYGTGMSWNSTWKMQIEIVNESSNWIRFLQFRENVSGIRNNEGITYITVNESSPKEIDQEFSLWISDDLGAVENWTGHYMLIDKFELALLNSQQLRIYRNAFYAHHGYKFKSEDLQNLFEKTFFYEINPIFSESEFNDIERKNIEMLLAEERRRKNERN